MNRLFRHIANLILAGAILTGCAYEDTVRSVREYRTGRDSLAIAFNDGFIENPVRTRAVDLPLTPLSSHMNTMGVWGWQTTSIEAVECLFLNKEVTFNGSLGKWTYSPVKYWDNNSTYRFCAYAPHDNSVPGVIASIDSTSLRISICGVTLNGSNTISKGVPELPGNFADVEDIDWMIDRNVQTMAGINHNEVAFNMQHILSKICVRVMRGDTFLPDSVMGVVIDSITIGDFIRQGDFIQSRKAAPEVLAKEWTPIDTMPRYTLCSARNVSVPDSALYVMESLLIPQPVNTTQEIDIWYRIGNPGGYINTFHNTFYLDEQFTQFLPGHNYILTFIVNPDCITFDGGQSGWNDVEWNNITIK